MSTRGAGVGFGGFLGNVRGGTLRLLGIGPSVDVEDPDGDRPRDLLKEVRIDDIKCIVVVVVCSVSLTQNPQNARKLGGCRCS